MFPRQDACPEERAAVAGSVAKHRIAKENDGGGWQLFFRFLEKLGERSSLARRAVREARAAFHSHPRSQHAMWSSPRSKARFNRARVRRALASLSTTAMLFLQQGGVNPAGRPLSSMAWSRALRAADSASRISPLTEVFMVRCVSPIAGRSSCDSVSGSESTTWCQDVISVPVCCRPHKYAAKGCGGTSR